jgi:hypothetical protein
MIRHIVIFQFDETKASEAEVMAIKAELEALVDHIPSLIKMDVGININTKEKQDLVLVADVKDLNDLDLYNKHPKHLEVAVKIRAIATGRTCVDYTV